MQINLTASKTQVLQEVFQATSYTAGKAENYDNRLLDRIQTTRRDEQHLDIFWHEARAALHRALIGLIDGDTMVNSQTAPYTLRLSVSEAFDTALLPTMNITLRNFFVNFIIARWFEYTNKAETETYALKAASLLDDLDQKARHKRPPRRPTRPGSSSNSGSTITPPNTDIDRNPVTVDPDQPVIPFDPSQALQR